MSDLRGLPSIPALGTLLLGLKNKFSISFLVSFHQSSALSPPKLLTSNTCASVEGLRLCSVINNREATAVLTAVALFNVITTGPHVCGFAHLHQRASSASHWENSFSFASTHRKLPLYIKNPVRGLCYVHYVCFLVLWGKKFPLWLLALSYSVTTVIQFKSLIKAVNPFKIIKWTVAFSIARIKRSHSHNEQVRGPPSVSASFSLVDGFRADFTVGQDERKLCLQVGLQKRGIIAGIGDNMLWNHDMPLNDPLWAFGLCSLKLNWVKSLCVQSLDLRL